MSEQQLSECLDQQKDQALKLVRNIIAMIDLALCNIQEIRRTKCLREQEMKLLKTLLVHGSHIIQNLFEMFCSTPQEKEKINDIIKRFAKIFQQMRVLQFRDLFTAAEEEFFGFVIETKALMPESGIYYFADYLLTFQP